MGLFHNFSCHYLSKVLIRKHFPLVERQIRKTLQISCVNLIKKYEKLKSNTNNVEIANASYATKIYLMKEAIMRLVKGYYRKDITNWFFRPI